MDPALLGARLVAAVHLAWVLFTVFGAFFCFRRPRAKWVHLAVMAYGVVITFAGWVCPLTRLERHLLTTAGVESYDDDFIVHLIRVVLYPDVPQHVLGVGALVVLGWTLYLDFVHERVFGRRSDEPETKPEPGAA